MRTTFDELYKLLAETLNDDRVDVYLEDTELQWLTEILLEKLKVNERIVADQDQICFQF